MYIDLISSSSEEDKASPTSHEFKSKQKNKAPATSATSKKKKMEEVMPSVKLLFGLFSLHA